MTDALTNIPCVDRLVDDTQPTPNDHLVSVAGGEVLSRLLNSLPSLEAAVLKRRYGLLGAPAASLAEVGRQLNLSRQRVHQIETQALEKLRHPSRKALVGELLEIATESRGFGN